MTPNCAFEENEQGFTIHNQEMDLVLKRHFACFTQRATGKYPGWRSDTFYLGLYDLPRLQRLARGISANEHQPFTGIVGIRKHLGNTSDLSYR